MKKMKNRKNYLKSRKNYFLWEYVGMRSERPCRMCGHKSLMQIYQYDAWCCIDCNEWLEERCGYAGCPYCANRPDTPYEVFFRAKEGISNAELRKRWRRDNYQHKTDGRKRHENRLRWKEI